MPIPFGANIELLSAVSNFTRDMFETKAEMKAFAEYNLPDIFITTCKEDGNVYVFNKSNEVDPITGKWRPINASGSSSYDDLTNKPAIEGVTLTKDTKLEDLSVYNKDKVDELLDKKVDKEEGKGLSEYDFAKVYKEKLDGIESGAQKNVKSDWDETDADADSYILNKPTLFDGKYTSLTDKPTKLSEFTNDKNFIDITVENLENYYKNTEVYKKTEIDEKLKAYSTLSMLVVDELPEEGAASIIYLIKKTGTAGYLQYIYTLGEYALIGDTDVDLSEYPKKTDLKEVATSGDYKDLINKPELKEVATSGKYTDLTDTPTIDTEINEESSDENIPSSKAVYGFGSNYIAKKQGAINKGKILIVNDEGNLVLRDNSTSGKLENSITSNVDCGGIKSGTTIPADTAFETIFNQLLVKYNNPTVKLTLSAASIQPKWNTINSVTVKATATKGTGEIEGIKLYKGADEIGESTENPYELNYSESINSNTTFKAVVTDDAGKTGEASASISFVIPFCYGVSAATSISDPTELTNDNSAKSNKTYKFTANEQYLYFCYDYSYGNLTSITDSLGNENLQEFSNLGKVTVTKEGSEYEYMVYRSKDIQSVSNFSLTFKF